MCKENQREELTGFLKDQAKRYTACAVTINNQYTESIHDHTCGSWVGEDDMTALLIRKRGDHYTALLLDISKCYKIVRECFRLKTVKNRLVIFQPDGQTTLEQVTYDPEGETLIFGSYGLFIPEDVTLVRELEERSEILSTDPYEF